MLVLEELELLLLREGEWPLSDAEEPSKLEDAASLPLDVEELSLQGREEPLLLETEEPCLLEDAELQPLDVDVTWLEDAP